MAGETILIVDDVAVNLKLTDILLRNEGFEVHTAADAEAALGMLRGLRPDLMLVDIQMPGIDGLELTRRVKRNPLTRDIIVVALTARAMQEDEQNAIEAGCNGYITKPIDTSALGRRLRQHLEARRPPKPSPWQARDARSLFTESELEGPRRRFLEEGMAQFGRLLESVERGGDLAEAGTALKACAATARLLGYPAIAERARACQHELLGEPRVDRLRDCLTDLISRFAEPREASARPLPEAVRRELSGKEIALIGFAGEEGERLEETLQRAGARPRCFEYEDLTPYEPSVPCAGILLQVGAGKAEAGWIARERIVPLEGALILAGPRDRILGLDAGVRACAADYLLDAWQPEEAVIRLSRALGRTTDSVSARRQRTP